MKCCVFLLLIFPLAWACGPGRGAGRGRGPRKLTPLVFKQHVPNVPENSITASGGVEGIILKDDPRFKELEPNYNQDIQFKDEEGTGADRLMTQRCKEKLNTLAISVMNQWPGVKLLVTEGWDEDRHHSEESLHYEGRAVDITTSDRDRSKYGMLARLAVEAGFDWVFYESRSHIHCSVKSESSQAAKYGGCFPKDTMVTTSTGSKKSIQDLQIGESILARNPATNELVFSEVLTFLDYDPLAKRDFQQVTLKSGRTLTLTGSHLVTVNKSRELFAAELKLGDLLLVSDQAENRLVEDEVVDLRAVFRSGVFAPLTELGNLVVNDVVASCYATVDSQSLAHWAFTPLRLVSNLQRGMHRMWTTVTMTSTRSGGTVTPPTGVHWYAKLLYSVASYVVPNHLHN